MAKFAIVRADGSVDVAEGLSVQDVSDRYGAPGNGSIEPFGPQHNGRIAHEFNSPAEQYAAWEAVAASEGQPGFNTEDDE